MENTQVIDKSRIMKIYNDYLKEIQPLLNVNATTPVRLIANRAHCSLSYLTWEYKNDDTSNEAITARRLHFCKEIIKSDQIDLTGWLNKMKEIFRDETDGKIDEIIRFYTVKNSFSKEENAFYKELQREGYKLSRQAQLAIEKEEQMKIPEKDKERVIALHEQYIEEIQDLLNPFNGSSPRMVANKIISVIPIGCTGDSWTEIEDIRGNLLFQIYQGDEDDNLELKRWIRKLKSYFSEEVEYEINKLIRFHIKKIKMTDAEYRFYMTLEREAMSSKRKEKSSK